MVGDDAALYVRFDEDSGGTVADASGAGHDGGFFGSPYQQGQEGLDAANEPASKSVHFSDGNARALIGYNAFNPYGPHTFESWVCRDDDGLNDDVVWGGSGGSNYTHSPYLLMGANGTTVTFGPQSGGGGTASWTGLSGVAECHQSHPTDWTQLVLVVNTSPGDYSGISHDTAGLYVNGVGKGWRTVSDNYELDGLNFQVGSRIHDLASDKPFDGHVDEVSVYQRLLTPTEIQEHYVAGREIGIRQPAPPDPPAEGTVYDVPGSVPTGCTSGSTDATSALLTWLSTVPDNATAKFAAGTCYRIEGTLELQNRNLTIDGNGATFKALNGPIQSQSLWRFKTSNVALRNMTVTGSYANGGTYEHDVEHAHGIDLRGSNALIEGVQVSGVGGDCVYFGFLGSVRSSGTFRDSVSQGSTCEGTGRNGVSVVGGDDVTVDGVTTDLIGYIVFDVEPNTGGGGGNGSARAAFKNNTIGSWGQHDVWAVLGNAPISDQSFTNNTMSGSNKLKVAVLGGSNRPQRVLISGNRNQAGVKSVDNALNISRDDDVTVTGNTIPVNSGDTMAGVAYSCHVSVTGNTYAPGSQEASITNPSC